MPDDITPEIETTSIDTPASTPPVSRKKSYPLATTVGARNRLDKILHGAAKQGTLSRFRGPVAHAWLKELIEEWDDSVKALKAGRRGVATDGEQLEDFEAAAETAVSTVHRFVDVYYPLGSTGRKAFFSEQPGVRPLAEVLEACIHGVQADRALEEPLLDQDDPELAPDHLHHILHGLKQQMQGQVGNAESLEAAMARRNATGDRIRDAVKDAEALVRLICRHEPKDLAQYGIKPFVYELRRAVGKRKVTTRAVKGTTTPASTKPTTRKSTTKPATSKR